MPYEQAISRAHKWFAGTDDKFKFTIYEDDTSTGEIDLTRIRDVTGYALSWILRRRTDDADPALLTKTTAVGGGIAITGVYNVSPALNTQRIEVTISDTDTESLAVGTYRHSLKRTDDGNEKILAFGNAVLQRATVR